MKTHLFSLLLFIVCCTNLYSIECPFCSPTVIEKQKVLETDHFWVLADYAPITYGHVLIVTKEHMERLETLDPELGVELLTLYRKVNDAFKSLFDVTDSIIIEKNGPAAGQSVPHVHFHVIPMRKDGWKALTHLKILSRMAFGSRPDSPEEVEKIVTLYRNYFGSTQEPSLLLPPMPPRCQKPQKGHVQPPSKA